MLSGGQEQETSVASGPAQLLPSPWTPENEASLRKHWDDGYSCSQIGAALGFTRNAIIGKARRLGLDSRREAMYKLTPQQKLDREQARTRQKINRQRERRLERLSPDRLPPRIIEETIAPAEFLNLTFDELQSGDCRYPRGNGPYTFCGQPSLEGHSYCNHCYRITHQFTPKPAAKPFLQHGWRAA